MIAGIEFGTTPFGGAQPFVGRKISVGIVTATEQALGARVLRIKSVGMVTATENALAATYARPVLGASFILGNLPSLE